MNMFVSVAAAVAGLLFGLDIGVIAGALPFITDHFVLTSRLQEWVVSSMMLGAAIGALFNGWLSFRPGVIQPDGGAILFVLGSIGSAFATSVEMLIAARVVLGIVVGIASYTAPLYLSEMASENVRGKMISAVTLGNPIQRSVIAVTGAQCTAVLIILVVPNTGASAEECVRRFMGTINQRLPV